MLQFERDFFISRIRCGYLRFRLDGEQYIFRAPTNDLAYEANEVYSDYYEDCINDGLITDDQTLSLLLEFKLWDDKKDELLTKKVPEYLENAKVEMWKSFHKTKEVETMRLYLNRAKEELVSLYETRHQFDYLSCHGAAIYARWQFIIERCVTLRDSSPDWDTVSVSAILSAINSYAIEETQIRELARTDPWTTIWSVNRKNNNLFGIPSCDFSEDQKRLVCWSMLFENVAEAEESPSEELIEDDDCFDGWLINRRREQKKESDKDIVEKRIGKNGEADEIYVPVGDDQTETVPLLSPEMVLGMNNGMASQIMRSRINAIQNSDGGQLKEFDLPDMRLKMEMLANRK